MFFLLVSIHLIGVQPWCTFDKSAKILQCNYEDRDACETYRYTSETCVPNPQFKGK